MLKETSALRPAFLRDLACIAVLVPIAVALHLRFPGQAHLSKDGIAYLIYSRDLLEGLALHLPAWIHVDSGMILPPVFPFLIGLANGIFSGSDTDAIMVAKHVSTVCLSLASIPLYFLLKSWTSRTVSLFAVGGIHLNLSYWAIGGSGLTESTFVLVVAAALVVLLRCSEDFNARLGILLGLVCALAFLTRQIGLIVFPLCLGWLALASIGRGFTLKRSVRMLAVVSLGFFVIFANYAGLLYAQTGQHPFQQAFRWNRYAVSTQDPAVLEEIARISAKPTEHYGQLYAQRRLMFQLTPDGAEMYHFLLESDSTPKNSGLDPANEARSLIQVARDVASNLEGNLDHLHRMIGSFYYWAFLLATLSVFLPPVRKWSPWRRRIVLAFVWTYIFSLSFLGDLVARYMVVLIPFVVIASAIEFFRVARALTRNDKATAIFAIGVVCVGTFFMPRLDPSQTPRKLDDRQWPQLGFRGSVERGTRVLALNPLDTYLIGGSWMILPNDSLERVVAYGRKTNTLWIFVARYPMRAADEAYYAQKAGWYRDRHLELHYPDLVQRCQLDETRGYRFDLYRIRPELSVGSSDPDECRPVISVRGVYFSKPMANSPRSSQLIDQTPALSIMPPSLRRQRDSMRIAS